MALHKHKTRPEECSRRVLEALGAGSVGGTVTVTKDRVGSSQNRPCLISKGSSNNLMLAIYTILGVKFTTIFATVADGQRVYLRPDG